MEDFGIAGGQHTDKDIVAVLMSISDVIKFESRKPTRRRKRRNRYKNKVS